jgi:hypothetical protein
LRLQIRVAGVRRGEVGVLEQATGGVKRRLPAGLVAALSQDRVHHDPVKHAERVQVIRQRDITRGAVRGVAAHELEVLRSRVRPRPQTAHEDAAVSRQAGPHVSEELTVLDAGVGGHVALNRVEPIGDQSLQPRLETLDQPGEPHTPR